MRIVINKSRESKWKVGIPVGLQSFYQSDAYTQCKYKNPIYRAYVVSSGERYNARTENPVYQEYMIVVSRG